MAQVMMSVCDVCGQPSVGSYKITQVETDQTTKVDLCKVHGRPVQVLFDDHDVVPDLKGSTRRRVKQPKVYTIEEIEEMKSEG